MTTAEMLDLTRKCRCGKPHEGWPAKDGGELCQDCWEAQCDAEWWGLVIAIDKAQALLAEAEKGMR